LKLTGPFSASVVLAETGVSSLICKKSNPLYSSILKLIGLFSDSVV